MTLICGDENISLTEKKCLRVSNGKNGKPFKKRVFGRKRHEKHWKSIVLKQINKNNCEKTTNLHTFCKLLLVFSIYFYRFLSLILQGFVFQIFSVAHIRSRG